MKRAFAVTVVLVCLASGTGEIVGWGQQVVGPTGALVAISAGSDDSLGLKSDGSAVAWGRNSEGQCNVPSPNSGPGVISEISGATRTVYHADGIGSTRAMSDSSQAVAEAGVL